MYLFFYQIFTAFNKLKIVSEVAHDREFKLGGGGGGAHLQKLRQKIIFLPIAEGGAKVFGVFRVKNHDFTPKNHIFSNFRGAHPPWIRPCMTIKNIY